MSKAPEWERCAVCGQLPQFDVFPADGSGVLLPTVETRVYCAEVAKVECPRLLCRLFTSVRIQAPTGQLSVDTARRVWNAMQRDGGSAARRAAAEFLEAQELRADRARGVA